jgi:hypothetical protein
VEDQGAESEDRGEACDAGDAVDEPRDEDDGADEDNGADEAVSGAPVLAVVSPDNDVPLPLPPATARLMATAAATARVPTTASVARFGLRGPFGNCIPGSPGEWTLILFFLPDAGRFPFV